MKFFGIKTGLILVCTSLLSIAPISNANLSKELDKVLDIIQAERKDKIDYIDNYNIIREKVVFRKISEGKRRKEISIDIRFFVKTRRGAQENFLLRTNYIEKYSTWNYLSFKILDFEQTMPPVIRPARKTLPNKQIVFQLIRERLKKDSNNDQRYEIHAIDKKLHPKFEWGENYTRTRFVFNINSKLIERDYNNHIRDYYKCNWHSLVEYNEVLKKWVLLKINKPSKDDKVISGCEILKQNFQEKVDGIFPGESLK